MRLYIQTFEQDGKYGWSLLDELNDEVSSSTRMLSSKDEAIKEARAARSDFDDLDIPYMGFE